MSEMEKAPNGEVLVPLEAVCLGRADGNWIGDAVLWKLNRTAHQRESDDAAIEFDYVVTSKTVATYSGPETYAFPTDQHGRVLDWGELPGSQRGSASHQEVIQEFCETFVDGEVRQP